MHPRRSALQQHVTTGSRHSKADPETVSHYLIIIKTLKWNYNDNKIMWQGSWIHLRMPATSLAFPAGKGQR